MARTLTYVWGALLAPHTGRVSNFCGRSIGRVEAALRDTRPLAGAEDCRMTSEQLDEFIDCQLRVADDGAQQRFLDGPARVDGDNGSRVRLRMDQDEVASLLLVFDESRAFESLDDLPRVTGWELCHGSGRNRDRNADPALKRWSFFGNRLPVG